MTAMALELNKVVNNAHYRLLGQPTLRSGCPLPQR